MKLFILSISIFISINLFAQTTATTAVTGCAYISEVQDINVGYKEDEFKTLAQHVLYPEYGDTGKNLSSEALASEWLNKITSSLGTGIDPTDAKYVIGPNGLFSYLVNEINTLPVDNESRKADYTLLLCINERIYADKDKPGYKDIETPKPYAQLHALAKKEIGESTGQVNSSTLVFYNKDLASESLGTRTFLSSVVNNINNPNTPSVYTKNNIELLINMSLKEKYLEKARNYLSQARKIIFDLPGKSETLTNKLEAAEKVIKERPANDLIGRVRDTYYPNTSDEDIIVPTLESLESRKGKLDNATVTQIALGTPEDNFEDNIFATYINTVEQTLAVTATDRLIDKIRIMILCNNDIVQLANGEKISIVDFFSADEALSFTHFFLGEPGTELFPITEALFKDMHIEGLISEEEMENGVKRFNSIESVLKK